MFFKLRQQACLQEIFLILLFPFQSNFGSQRKYGEIILYLNWPVTPAG